MAFISLILRTGEGEDTLKKSFILLALSFGAAASLSASIVTYPFQATVYGIDGAGVGSAQVGDVIQGSISWDTAMTLTSSGFGQYRFESWDQSGSASSSPVISLMIGSYTLTTDAPERVSLWNDGAGGTELEVSAFLNSASWPSGLTPAPTSSAWLDVSVSGSSNMFSTFNSLPASIDTGSEISLYGFVNPDAQYQNVVWFSEGSGAFDTSAPEPASLGACGLGGAMIWLLRRRISAKRRA
jgi:hypothetical protein